MTKRNSRKKKTSSSNSQSTSNHKFSIFEFNPDDERVEKHSKKLLQAFKIQKPKKIHSPIDKYTFLGFCTFLQNPNFCFQRTIFDWT